MLKNWEKVVISPNDSIYEAISVVDKYASQIALVTDGNEKLVGTVTDGDVRRALLKGLTLSEPVHKIMNKNPNTESFHKSREDIFLIMKDKGLKHLPVVNEQGMVRGLYSIRDFISVPEYENWAISAVNG